jgi:hypothetical protein
MFIAFADEVEHEGGHNVILHSRFYGEPLRYTWNFLDLPPTKVWHFPFKLPK